MASNNLCASLRVRSTNCAIVVVLLSLFGAASLPAQILGSRDASKASTRRSDRNNAIAAIPFDELVPSAADRIRTVVDSPSIYRKLPTQTIQCDSELFVFLVRNPETVVHVWRKMGITALTLDRTGPYQFHSTDGAGTKSEVELVYGTKNLHVFFGRGEYEGPLFKQHMTGDCVIVLRSQYNERSGQPATTARLDVFVKMPNVGIDVAAKTLHPLFGKAADVNFVETAKFFEKLNSVAVRNPQGIERLAGRLDGVQPTVRQNFSKVAYKVNEKRGRSLSRSAPPTESRPITRPPVQRVSGSRAPGSVRRISRFPASGPVVR